MKSTSLLAIVLIAALPPSLHCSSVYTQRLDDKAAVYLTAPSFDVHADGIADDSAALQKAIDQVSDTTRQGIVFIPEGHYRITRTIYVWPGIRLIGYGTNRPVFTLAHNTPGFQQGIGYMLFFTGGRPGQSPRRPNATNRPSQPFPGTVPLITDVIDANPGTFYSAISNIDFEIGDGNPAAVGIRFHIAQHCFMSHMDFHIGSGLAAIKDTGNEAEDLHFFGGDFGIITEKPSPGWQYTLLDSTFDGQRKAAISEHEAGLTLVGDQFRNTPSVVTIDAGYADELWIQHSRFENISGPALIISNENNERTEIHAQDIACSKVPTLALFRESTKQIAAPSEIYLVRDFSHGLLVHLAGDSAIDTNILTDRLTALPPLAPPVIKPLPDPTTWVNLKSLGAKGDGVTDDTDAIQSAIANHPTLYIPSGRYLVSRTILLKPETVLIGLHPSTTQFDLADSNPAFDGPGAPVALLQTPAGGTNTVSGIGLFTGGINSRAVAALWQSGKDSLMDDVRFLGGHGTNNADGSRMNPYNNTHTADPDIRRRWDGQYPSLWVLNNGGGTFSNIWTPDTFAQAGMYISNTTTPGHVYELSSEHHVRTEVKLDHASNWEIISLQTEEEHGEGPSTLPLEIDNSTNILVANMHSYRVVGSLLTFPYAISVAHSKDIRFYNLHVDSDSKVAFDDSVFDQDTNASTRFHELATLIIPDTATQLASKPSASEPALKRVATGFFNISGATADAEGRLYFIDYHWQKIYRWSPQQGLEIIRDSPLDATNLAIDHAGNLIVISYAGKGTVYTFKPDAPPDQLTVLTPQPAIPRPGLDASLPVDHWKLRDVILNPQLLARPFQYVSPDGTTFIPAGQDFVEGQLYYGTKMSDVLRSFSLSKATPNHPFYITDEEEHKTYSATVNPDGSLSNLKLFAERGGESVATAPSGDVYIAAGEIYVYSPEGKFLRTINTPERPTDLIFAGPHNDTLFILARTSLYSIPINK